MTNPRSTTGADVLEHLFAQTFFNAYHTILQGGAEEPEYRPGTGSQPSCIYYTRDYFRSALHEIAHWCVAGPARRMLADYGYWYAPDGRTAAQQAEFEKMEVYPQALELIFSAACGHRFRVSLDNLTGEAGRTLPFETAVLAQAEALLANGLSERAAHWATTLADHYRGCRHLQPEWLPEVFSRW